MRVKLSGPLLATGIGLLVGLAALTVACGAPPAPTPAVPPPAPRLVDAGVPEEGEAERRERTPTADAGPVDAGPVDAAPARAADHEPDAGASLASGPVRDEADAVERAARAANVALDKAYALFVKKAQIAPTHTGAWTRGSMRHVTAKATGWEVTFASHPPAGFEHEAVIHVSPSGVLTVKKAVAQFSPD